MADPSQFAHAVPAPPTPSNDNRTPDMEDADARYLNIMRELRKPRPVKD